MRIRRPRRPRVAGLPLASYVYTPCAPGYVTTATRGCSVAKRHRVTDELICENAEEKPRKALVREVQPGFTDQTPIISVAKSTWPKRIRSPFRSSKISLRHKRVLNESGLKSRVTDTADTGFEGEGTATGGFETSMTTVEQTAEQMAEVMGTREALTARLAEVEAELTTFKNISPSAGPGGGAPNPAASAAVGMTAGRRASRFVQGLPNQKLAALAAAIVESARIVVGGGDGDGDGRLRPDELKSRHRSQRRSRSRRRSRS